MLARRTKGARNLRAIDGGRRSRVVAGAFGVLLAVTAVLAATAGSAAGQKTKLRRPAHVVVVIMENHSYSQVIGAPYIHHLAKIGASFTNSHGITHPSQPNYLALFSGSTRGVSDDHCPVSLASDNLGHQLRSARDTFAGYSEDLPSVGSTTCNSGGYARRHTPWVDFSNLPGSVNRPLTSFPRNYSSLPTVSIVVPNLCHDMHDCSVSTGDTWLKTHIDGFVRWAATHNSLLVLTWDEDDFTSANHIATVFAGPMVKHGNYGEPVNHYNVLRTLEDFYGLAHLGGAAGAKTITNVWK